MRRAVFMDRDGTINAMVYNAEFGLVDSPANLDEFELLPGVGDAVKLINNLGFLAVIVSNQPGIAKGKITKENLEKTTGRMHQLLDQQGAQLEAVYYCLHHPQAIDKKYRIECDCRKPKPGLLKKAARDLDIDTGKSYIVGDGITDIITGRETGVVTIFAGTRKAYIWDEMSRQNVCPDFIVKDLMQAVQIIQKIEEGDKSGLEEFSPPESLKQSTR